MCRYVTARQAAVRQYAVMFEACGVCGRGPLHRLGCPLLTKVTGVAALFFAAVTVVLVGISIAGGPRGKIAVSVGVAAFFGIYWAASRLKSTPSGRT